MKKVYGILLAIVILVGSVFPTNTYSAKEINTKNNTEIVKNNSSNDHNSGGSSSETKTSKPKLIIENYAVTPNPIKVGEEFDLNIAFYNTSKNKAIKNIKIVLNSTGESTMNSSSEEKSNNSSSSPSINRSVFMPVRSSNTFYIDSIGAGRRISKIIKLTSPYDTAPNTYELGVSMEYEDYNN